MEQDEIYLIDLWRIFAREWRWFALVLALCLAAAYAFGHAARRQWEATAWVQVGQLGITPQGQDPKVEPFQRVIERLQTVWFQNEALAGAGFALDAPEAALYRKSLKVDPSPYASLIKLSLRATSPQLARQLAMATVAKLQAIHRQLGEAPLELGRARLDQVQEALRNALADRERLQKTAAGDGGVRIGADQEMAGVLLASKNGEIRTLQQEQEELANRLSPHYTYETGLLWPVYVPERPASPNLALIWGAGVLGGLFLGACAAIARNVLRRAAASGGQALPLAGKA